jgi:two-component system, chemotaxis family, protein-glutamate methylesterase/glutaminase
MGGLDALRRVLKVLPAQLSACVFALQHADPSRASQLARLLDRVGPLRSAEAGDGAALAPGHVLVASSGFHTLVTRDRTLALVRSGERPPNRPSADLLLGSLAVAVGSDAVAVVLTGFGHDGAAGATASKRVGGVLIASSLATRRSPRCPRRPSTPASSITSCARRHRPSPHRPRESDRHEAIGPNHSWCAPTILRRKSLVRCGQPIRAAPSERAGGDADGGARPNPRAARASRRVARTGRRPSR